MSQQEVIDALRRIAAVTKGFVSVHEIRAEVAVMREDLPNLEAIQRCLKQLRDDEDINVREGVNVHERTHQRALFYRYMGPLEGD